MRKRRGSPDGYPTTEWIEEVFLTQAIRGRMHEVRGAFKTVHRDWAVRLIGAGIASPRTRESTEQLLAPSLSLHAKDPIRLMRLMSWLWYDEQCGPYLRRWLARQTEADWSSLVGIAVSKGLKEVGIVADKMHLLFQSNSWDSTVRSAFVPHEELLSLSIATAGPSDWPSLKSLAFTLAHACPDLAARCVESWAPEAAASILETTHPDYYNTAGWTLSAISEHSPAWVELVGKSIRWEKISDQLSGLRRGDVDAVMQCVQLVRKLRIPLRRSMVRRYTSAMVDVISHAHLAELDIGIGTHHFWWMMYPGDLEHVVEQLSATRIAEDLVQSHPRDWRRLVELSSFVAEGSDSFFVEVIDKLDIEAFIANVEGQLVGLEYELRCLIWVLCRGRLEQRKLLATKLYALVREACQRSDAERLSLLIAFNELDSSLGKQLITESSVDSSAYEKHVQELREDQEADPEGVVRDLFERVAIFEACYDDYIIDIDNMQISPLT